jgi:4-hydroxythreonine-4-phosphate dehydrogenase
VSPLPLLVTQGDPCGIGPEIVARAAVHAPSVVVVGDVGVVRRGARHAGIDCVVAEVDAPEDAAGLPAGVIAVWTPPGLPSGLERLPLGRVHADAGRAAAVCIEAAAALALQGRALAVVTAPIHKEALAAAGIGHPGHTEMLQALCAQGGERPPVRMMLATPELRVVLVTIHVSLRRAIDAVTFDAVLETIRIAHAAEQRQGRSHPRIAVAGLNPHAGEGGLFGDEERDVIRPAVDAARALGIDAHGPFAPDTVFMRARRAPGHPGEFDLVVAMTHDHGLIPIKLNGFDQGVNVTLGLPFVRTSPDHGTAFDIAGTGRADPASLDAAIALARQLAGEPQLTVAGVSVPALSAAS